MQFREWFESSENYRQLHLFDNLNQTKESIRLKATTEGIPVRRGQRAIIGNRPYQSDPGDLGRGVYYSTNFNVAKNYGQVSKSILKLKNPLVLTDEEAYKMADMYQTVRLSEEEIDRLFQKVGRQNIRQAMDDKLLQNAQDLTNDMLAAGHDSMIIIKHNALEIVVYASQTSQ